ncbi:MAG: UbiA family prenyltransferase [Pseudomonadota bacterium]
MGSAAPSASLPARLWTYQSERFPLGKTALLCAIFSSASVSVSAHLAERAPPSLWAYGAAFMVTLAFFFQLRVLDEIKDKEDDAKFRPERPIPRGLVRLETIIWLGVGSVFVALGVAAAVDTGLLALLGVAWGWLTLMSFEFFVRDWLKSHAFLYLVSHMAIMPLIDLVVTGFEWVRFGAPAGAMVFFLLLSFTNGCVLEIGRKLWAPVSEREGVNTYSKLLGPRTGAMMWLTCVAVSLGLLVAVGFATRTPLVTGAIGALAALFVLRTALSYRADPTPERATKVEDAAGIWVFACYAAAGFAPFTRMLLA